MQPAIPAITWLAGSYVFDVISINIPQIGYNTS